VEQTAYAKQADKIEHDEIQAPGDRAPLNSNKTLHLMPLKVLNCSLVFPGCRLCLERPQISALSRFRIFLSRI
jgi:hypothetical protein